MANPGPDPLAGRRTGPGPEPDLGCGPVRFGSEPQSGPDPGIPKWRPPEAHQATSNATGTSVFTGAIQRSNISQHRGMLDIPAELFLTISTHMDHRDLRALALTSRFLCDLLLPEYLRRHGLKLKGTYTGGTGVDLYDLSGYASLGLWSIVPTFCPPKMMYCSIPYDAQEAQSVIGFLTRFLLDPSNSTNLQSFHFSVWDVDPFPIMSELIKIQGLFCVLPLTRLCISGHGSAAFLPPSITLWSGMSCGSHTLMSLHISSDLAFAPGLSPIKNLAIYMVSLNPSQWSTLLGQLNMMLLEDIKVEGDIPRPALIRFLMKHRGLKVVRIGGKVPSDRTTQPSRSQSRCFLPNLRTLHAPLAICSDIIRRASDPSSLYELHVEVDQLHPHDHLFLHLVEALQRFQKLNHLGL
ncbi:hypothetical protein EDB89DRAFT_1904808 [Lactarius sanguifluus]|nr:hypothetical protein EDB89DRAFT_1904808 [Lactarius sanguifluus]